jgi:hypothetical protein
LPQPISLAYLINAKILAQKVLYQLGEAVVVVAVAVVVVF